MLLRVLVILLCNAIAQSALCGTPGFTEFAMPERVTILGYADHTMEPFISADGRYLFFNNSNDPAVDTNLHYAEYLSDLTYTYKGQITGANTDALEGVPTMDSAGNFYFVSTRSYEQTLSTIYGGQFINGLLNNVALVPGLSKQILGQVNFDVEISTDGNFMYFVDGLFSGQPFPDAADLVLAIRNDTGFLRDPASAAIFATINTAALEYAAAISSNGTELFFTRLDGMQTGIYHAWRATADAPFGEPQRINVIDGFVEAPTLSADGRRLFYHRRDGALFVIYRVTREPRSASLTTILQLLLDL